MRRSATQGPKLGYLHIGNIDIFFTFLRIVELPEVRLLPPAPSKRTATDPVSQIFRFETVDLYDAKNMPKVIYCIHALSILLARRGLADRMNNLVGQIEFTGVFSFRPKVGDIAHSVTRYSRRAQRDGQESLWRADAQLRRNWPGAVEADPRGARARVGGRS